ncbi:MAG: M56 family metallopeptidase, partial [Balneolaceae bacterium]
MEPILLQLSDFARLLIDLTWLPLLIWTLISFVVWLGLQISENIHPEYQYHTRLALIFALPAGLIFLALAHQISDIFTSAADSGLVFISVVSPLDISVTPIDEMNGISFISIVYIAVVVLFASGLLYYTGRFITQCIQLNSLRNRCALIPISNIEQLSSSNLGLALATRKNVCVAFMSSEIIPVTFGFRKPVILLPETLRNNEEKLNIAIRHELTHITQHDFFSHLLVMATESFFWFHPFVHRLSRELIEYREMRCDNIVLTETTISRKKYASLLLELIPMANIDKELSVNMAQESSNLKKRISMITQQTKTKPIPKRSSIALLALIFISTTLIMACTDMQTQTVFDEEDLDLMTNLDRTGEMGYHEVIIFMSEENQAEKHESKLAKLQKLQPEHIQ